MLSNQLRTPSSNIDPSPQLIFTNLEGSLIDHKTNSWLSAKPALLLAKKKAVPIIPCSSKTFEECLEVQKSLDLSGPFIFENGTGIAFPQNSFDRPSKYCSSVIKGYWLCDLSTPYIKIREALQELRLRRRFKFQGFGDMSIEQLMEITGASAQSAEKAKARRHSEPVLWQDGPKEFDAFLADMTGANLQATRGGRFIHISGAGNKGTAMQWLAKIYARKYGQIPYLIAIGDSMQDEPMLKAAHTAVIIKPTHTAPIPKSTLNKNPKDIILTKESGSKAWGEAVLSLLK